jgi:hypothetical protein
MKRTDIRPQPFTKELVCDRCGREAELDDTDCEFHEFTSLAYKAGYGSVLGDGNNIELDLCQHCVKETLGTWLRITDPYAGFDPVAHGGEFPHKSQASFVKRGRAAIHNSIANDDGVPAEEVIAKLEKKLALARIELADRQRKTTHLEHPMPSAFTIGSQVVTSKSLPHHGLESGAHGTIVRLHDNATTCDVEFVNLADGSTSLKTVEADCLTAWILL